MDLHVQEIHRRRHAPHCPDAQHKPPMGTLLAHRKGSAERRPPHSWRRAARLPRTHFSGILSTSHSYARSALYGCQGQAVLAASAAERTVAQVFAGACGFFPMRPPHFIFPAAKARASCPSPDDASLPRLLIASHPEPKTPASLFLPGWSA